MVTNLVFHELIRLFARLHRYDCCAWPPGYFGDRWGKTRTQIVRKPIQAAPMAIRSWEDIADDTPISLDNVTGEAGDDEEDEVCAATSSACAFAFVTNVV
jgi:hypothetical protein